MCTYNLPNLITRKEVVFVPVERMEYFPKNDYGQGHHLHSLFCEPRLERSRAHLRREI